MLAIMMKDSKYEVIGLILLDGQLVFSSQFPKNINLMMQSTPDNINKAMKVLNLYCEGPRSILNLKKMKTNDQLTTQRSRAGKKIWELACFSKAHPLGTSVIS